jgi:hypothetical protein
MSRLFSDLATSSSRRFFSALTSAPGFISPAPAVITLGGNTPIAVQNLAVFRTPAPAILNFVSQSLSAPVVLSPIPAALSLAGQIPARALILTISPALPAPIENPPAPLIPTLITIWTASPAAAQFTLQTLEQNVTQGGNIGFVSPAPAQVSLGTQAYTLLLGSEIGVGQVSLAGLVPDLHISLTIEPEVGAVAFNPLISRLSLPFGWVDDDPVPVSTWITDAAA